MTEREIRNAEWKSRIRLNAEAYCEYIDIMEEEIKDRERMVSELSGELDRLNKQEKNAA
jgi:hypothetical protein